MALFNFCNDFVIHLAIVITDIQTKKGSNERLLIMGRQYAIVIATLKFCTL